MPLYTAFVGFAFMASLGLPGLSGFIGEVLMFLGAFPGYACSRSWSRRRRCHHRRVPPLGAAAGAARHLQRALARRASPARTSTARELLTLLPLAVIVLVLGFWPMPLLSTIAAGVRDLVAAVTP